MIQVNFDGLVGPTHHYGGLSTDNFPSTENQGDVSNPKKAALQGLKKMKLVSELGVKQAVLPPPPRPAIKTARRIGYRGSPGEIIAELHRDDPELLSSISSSANMWAANAATVSPAPDSADNSTHLTPANLVSSFHRSIEPDWVYNFFSFLFDGSDVKVHDPLPSNLTFRDEGSANHLRLSAGPGEAGIQIFVYGDEKGIQTSRHPARQTLRASRAVARLHDLDPARIHFIRQNDAVIDHGGFHNDLVAVGNDNVLLHHTRAFSDGGFSQRLKDAFGEQIGKELISIRVEDDQLPLDRAVSSYFFNSQLISTGPNTMTLIAAEHLRSYPEAKSTLNDILEAENPITDRRYVSLRQSMKNGGGPACLRLKTELPETAVESIPDSILLNDDRYETLKECVTEYYPEKLTREKLAEPSVYDRCRRVYRRLSRVLNLTELYSETTLFQS